MKTEDRSTRSQPWRRHAEWLAALVLFLAAFGFSAEQVAEHEMLSPIDEYQYIGYYALVADEGVIRQGTAMPFFARKYMVCNGVRAIPEMAPNPPACRAPNSINYPIEGGTTADLYSPLYFWSIRALAQPMIWAGVDFVSAGRLANGAWLGLGAVFLYLAMRRARTPVSVALGLGLVLVGSLPAYWSNTYISTDAGALAAGAVAAWLTIGALRGVRGSLVLLPVAGAFFTVLKLQNLIAFVVAAAVLLFAVLLDARHARTRTSGLSMILRDRRTLSAVMIGVASLVAQGVWLAIRSALAVGPQPALGVVGPLQGKDLLLELGNFLPQIAQGAMHPTATGPASLPVFAVGTLLAIGGAAGLAMSKGVEAQYRIVGVSTVLVGLLAAPALAISVSVLDGAYFPLPPRYGTALFPWALFSAALLIGAPRSWSRYVYLALGAITWALALGVGEA